MPQHFGRHKQAPKNIKRYTRRIHSGFFLLTIITFIVFAFYETITGLMFSKKSIDIFEEDLQNISLYFTTIDRDLARFVSETDLIVKEYLKGNNIFDTKQEELDFIADYLANNVEYLESMGFDSYTPFLKFSSNVAQYKEELWSYLGKNETKNYLIILQNTSEKRPNGGFFGSFAFVSIEHGFIKELEIIDSYYPDWIAPDIRVYGPERMNNFLPDNTIRFIAANKLGFTDMDGKHIQDLYQKIYETPIHGVIFITSDIVKKLAPRIQERLRERQFVNASIDIIRGEERSNKKEQYITQVNDFFNQNKFGMIKSFIKQFDTIIIERDIQVYLPNTTPAIQNFLQKQGLNNKYSPTKLYLRDTNGSHNKMDEFLHKQSTISQKDKGIILQSKDDIINIQSLEPGEYTLTIEYSIDVHNYYRSFINGLQQQYGIEMTRRERGILNLDVTYNYDLDEWHRRSSHGLIHFPPTSIIQEIRGDNYTNRIFNTPFSQGLQYFIPIQRDEDSAMIQIDFTLPHGHNE